MKLFFKRYSKYLKEHYKSFIIVLFSSIVVALSTAWGTYLVKPTLDDIFINKDVEMLKVLPFLVILAYFGKSGGIYLGTYFTNFIGLDIIKKLRNAMLESLLKMEMDFFNRTKKGELIARITNDIGLIRASLSNYLSESVREGLTIIGLVGVVIYQSPKLALVGLVIMPLAAIPISKIIRKVKKLAKANQESNAKITARLSEVFNNVEAIKISNGERLEHKAFVKENEAFFKIGIKNIAVAEISSPLMEFLGSIAIALVIYLGGNEVISGKISVGAFFSFITALFMLYTPIKRLTRIISNFQEALVASDRVHEILEREPSIIDGELVLDNAIHTIELKNVWLAYENEKRYALSDINLKFQQNEIIALKGESGSGKSSLVNLILRLYEPSKGEILINDKKIESITQKSLREKISIVTQRVFIFNGSVAENVAYGLEIDAIKIKECLKKAQALDFVEKLPYGIESILDEFGTNLSGGQRQRIAIARALYKDAQVLIFDEATSALDSTTEESIKQSILELRENRLIILISHNPSTLELATKHVKLEHGKLIEC
ncbi:ABC transporter ATP-binding protein [Helicobacter cetorum]|uniref:Multi-drug resistance protein n=1 Tax=Helicobacter cetorum (strain ATCC BAA-429 / MIT 00-7128) TaxID=182217 RepID=I0ELY2_HELC0|nr:ABC transporter ATP-binding protein [Helicobacter cetorum]AFI03951.1 multi-drug resistance protein [Helicobacter cetorum MIT 00-7128]